MPLYKPDSVDILRILRTQYADPFWEKLWLHFREYQLLLDAVLSQSTQDKGILDAPLFQESIDRIQCLIQEISEGTSAFVVVKSHERTVLLPIIWEDINHASDMTTAVTSILQAKPNEWPLIIYTDQLEDRKDDILSEFALCLQNIDFVLEDMTGLSMLVLATIRDSPEVVLWRLMSPESDLIQEGDLDDLEIEADVKEVVIGDYRRHKVNLPDLLKRNKGIKGIVKISLGFQTDSGLEWYGGTGWLIGNDTVVTAGHCVYDEKLGHLAEVKVMAGYGLSSLASYMQPTEYRTGVFASTLMGWYKTFSEEHDLGFIVLDKPFKRAVPIPWTTTPARGVDVHITVSGYPSDKPSAKNAKNGHRMYMSECSTTYDLDKAGGILEYGLDTYGGNSGSPVIRGDGKVIATHRGAGCAMGDYRKGKVINKGVIIDEGAHDIQTILSFLVLTKGQEDKAVQADEIGLTLFGSLPITRLRLWE